METGKETKLLLSCELDCAVCINFFRDRSIVTTAKSLRGRVELLRWDLGLDVVSPANARPNTVGPFTPVIAVNIL